jgi:hypothetical protein
MQRRQFVGSGLALAATWPLRGKAWGDVLKAQRKIKEALGKYNAALKYAPNWKQLKQARDAAVEQKP